jgi:hypothetical protein
MTANPIDAPRAASPAAPRQVLLFSGHRVDEPGRAVPRFPPDKERAVARRIAEELDRLGAGPSDLALTQGAAGGDLLFAEACLDRGVPLQLLLPLPLDAFIAQSILPSTGGAAWRDRFIALKARLHEPPRVADDELGTPPAGADPWERGGHWLLATALAHGADKLRFITLWDGTGGDGPGGTQHMVDEVRRHHGQLRWIDTRSL